MLQHVFYLMTGKVSCFKFLIMIRTVPLILPIVIFIKIVYQRYPKFLKILLPFLPGLADCIIRNLSLRLFNFVMKTLQNYKGSKIRRKAYEMLLQVSHARADCHVRKAKDGGDSSLRCWLAASWLLMAADWLLAGCNSA